MRPTLYADKVTVELLPLQQSAPNARRYTYGEHLQLNGAYTYGGTGSVVFIDEANKVKLSLQLSEPYLSIVINDTAPITPDTTKTIKLGQPLGLLLAITYHEAEAIN